MADSTTTSGNIQPQLDHKEHSDAADAKRVLLRALDGGTTPISLTSTTIGSSEALDVSTFMQRFGETTLTALNTTYNNTTTTATSAAISTTGAHWVFFQFSLVSANTPTDFEFFIEGIDGSDEFRAVQGFLGKFIFDDISTNPEIHRTGKFFAPGQSTFQIRTVATGTDATNTFVLSNAKVYLATNG